MKDSGEGELPMMGSEGSPRALGRERQPEAAHPRSRERRRHGCHLCSKSFATRRDLRTHLLVHEGRKPFPCHLCPATFAARSYLADHLQSHMGTKRCRCDLCPKSFLRPAQLARHRRVHGQRGNTTTTTT
ncbi:hypothetical protein HPB48_008141 [Haemaphysalis longicornis]|uniref:C2H2-type domain-containing protein n=1 Tax=Haemaphysalis longicornis TaxID=44386 RepID=A0A9J6FRQ4_HAELO|nr:hypothetical protein HPB48_008141 [Haemaphysalis longicornis]